MVIKLFIFFTILGGEKYRQENKKGITTALTIIAVVRVQHAFARLCAHACVRLCLGWTIILLMASEY